MSHFQILEDVENRVPQKIYRKQKFHGLNKEYVEKKTVAENNRGVLQPVNNGVRQDVKRFRLNTEERMEEIICLDESFKENVSTIEITEVDDDVLNIGKSEEIEISKKDESNSVFPKKLLFAAEYRKDIWRYLQDLEARYVFPKSNYMLKQTDLTWNTRSILVDWLASVSEEYKHTNETFHLSVNYIDRFLNKISVVRTKFQLVGAAAMSLSGKIEEIYPITINEWSYLTGDAFTPRQIMKMEQLIAKILRFDMHPPTMYTFIEHFCHEHNIDAETMSLALYISELVLLEGKKYLNYLPSKLAAASIALARHTLSKGHPWPEKFRQHCGYTMEQLSPVVQRQHHTFVESPHKPQQAIQTKYKSDKYHKVALLKPKKLSLDFFEED